MRHGLRGGWRAGLFSFAVALCLQTPLRAEQGVAIPVDQARAAAVLAWQHGDLETAQALTTRLLAADAQDPLAHHLTALMALAEGDLGTAQQAARRAYGAARSDLQRRNAALVAANIAARQERGVALRYWLRQATEAATTPEDRQSGQRALAQLRQISPWTATLRFSASPSNNVNGGADSPFNEIDGVPGFGTLDGDLQALSGFVAVANADLSYRLRQSAQSETRLIAGLYLKRVKLSDAAERQAVTLSGSDLASNALDLGLSHAMRPAGLPGTLEVDLGFGLGEDGDSGTRTTRLGLRHSLPVSDATELSFGMGWDMEEETIARGRTQRMPQINLSASHLRANGDRIGASASAYKVDSVNGQQRRSGGMLRASYALGAPVGPFRLSGSLGGSLAHYEDYMVGLIQPPGGRRDQTLFGEVNLMMPEVSWAGFAPQMTVRASRTDSNISAFDSTQVGIVFGLKSLF